MHLVKKKKKKKKKFGLSKKESKNSVLYENLGKESIQKHYEYPRDWTILGWTWNRNELIREEIKELGRDDKFIANVPIFPCVVFFSCDLP